MHRLEEAEERLREAATDADAGELVAERERRVEELRALEARAAPSRRRVEIAEVPGGDVGYVVVTVPSGEWRAAIVGGRAVFPSLPCGDRTFTIRRAAASADAQENRQFRIDPGADVQRVAW
jgi:hypothetical protein